MLNHFATAHTEQELYRYWHSLPAIYGPATSGHISAGDRLLNLLAAKMVASSSFAAAMVQFELEYNEANLPPEFRSALLFSDGSNDLKVQFLPPRFNAALAHIRCSNYTYDEAKTYLHQQDQLLTKVSTTAVINAVSTEPQQAQKRKGKQRKPTTALEGETTTAAASSAPVSNSLTNCCVVCCCGDSFQPTHPTDTFCSTCYKSFKEHQKKSKDHFIRSVRNFRTQEILDDYDAIDEMESGRYLP